MRLLWIFAALAVAGCATSVDRSAAHGFVKNSDFATVFRNTTSAAVQSGLLIVSTSSETGQIHAVTQDGQLLPGNAPTIDIQLERAASGVSVQIAFATERTFGGVMSTGSPSATLQSFCSTFTRVQRDATCNPDRPAGGRKK